jgi:hypothetical protein
MPMNHEHTRPSTISNEDRGALMDLLTRYVAAIDSADMEGYLSVFTPDGVLDMPDAESVGHDAIREYMTRLFARRQNGGPTSMHFVGMPSIQGNSERCTIRLYNIILRANPDGTVTIPLVSDYIDTCVKVDGQWFFERRIIRAGAGVMSSAPQPVSS